MKHFDTIQNWSALIKHLSLAVTRARANEFCVYCDFRMAKFAKTHQARFANQHKYTSHKQFCFVQKTIEQVKQMHHSEITSKLMMSILMLTMRNGSTKELPTHHKKVFASVGKMLC